MPADTSRDDLPYPLPSDPNDVPDDMEALADRMDAIFGPESSGTLASLPTPTSGEAGAKYFATDAPNSAGTTGVLYWDTGTGQVPINPAPVTNARTVLIPEGEWKMPWTERRTIPKNDNHRVIAFAQA